MKKKNLLMTVGILLVFIFLTVDSFAQSVTVSGQLRPRFEYRHGYKTLSLKDADAATFTSQRTRFNLKYADSKFKAGFSVQNIMVWGDVLQLNQSDVNGASIHEAWGEMIFSEKFSVKVGRQEIVYDDQRIFGSVGWAQQGRSHDAAILKIAPREKCDINVGFAFNQDKASLFGNDYTLNNYKSFQYLWWHRSFDKVSLSLLALNNGIAYSDNTDTNDVKQKIAYSQTIGPRITFKDGKFSANAAIYLQMGKLKPGSGTLNAGEKLTKLSAMYLSTNINYQANDNFSVGLGFEYLSGNSQVDAGDKNKAFTPLYGTNHKFNGWMDYFYVGNHGNSVGLIDIYVPIKYKKGKFSAMLIPHSFRTAADLHDWKSTDTKATMSNNLGLELDFTVGYAFAKNMVVKAGYSQMFATESMDALKNVASGNKQTNNWGWVMLVFNPTFFQSK
jgi:hypothetical protein